MPEYVQKALKQFQHKLKKKQLQPFPHTPIQYGAKKQYQRNIQKLPPSDQQKRNSFNKCVASFYIMDEQ